MSKALSSQVWRASPAPCLCCCNAVGLAARLEGARAGTGLPRGRPLPPAPQDTASFQSCCSALFGWKGWWVGDPLLLPLFFSSVPSSASSRPPMRKGMTLREQGWHQRAMLAGEEDVQRPPFALKPCVNIVKANPDP